MIDDEDVDGPSAEDRAMLILAEQDIPFKDGDDALRILRLQHERAAKRLEQPPVEPMDPSALVWLARDLAKDVIEMRKMYKEITRKAQAILDAVIPGVTPGGQKQHD